MKRNKFYFLKAPLGVWGVCCILLLSTSSCRKSKPQLPSNKPTRTEEKLPVIDLVKLNKEMVEREDSILNLYIQANELSFTKTESGFWYKKEHTTQNRLLTKNDICVIDYQLFLLDGTLCEEENGFKITIGKKEFITGLDEGLQLMRIGESAEFIFPWNLAFGMKGYKNLVPAYTSVILKVKLLN